MKNIYLLPTDKPSRLYLNTKEYIFENEYSLSTDECQNKNIYITSDEEIKEGVNQWYLDKVLNEPYNSGGAQYSSKQNVIILTTDQDLIKDGVQAIDDEFLEWFVKNPSCEFVEVEKTFVTNSGLGHQEYAVLNSDFKVLELVANIPQSSYEIGRVTELDAYEYVTNYQIIIPKEEPNRTHYLDELPNIDKKILSKMWEDVVPELEPKQEKLEETIGLKAHEYSMQYVGTDKYTVSMLAIEFGYHLALEQEQEKSYSEEDMHNLMDEYQNWLFNTNTVVLTFREWFKQFKKK